MLNDASQGRKERSRVVSIDVHRILLLPLCPRLSFVRVPAPEVAAVPANPPQMSLTVHDLVARMEPTAIVHQHDGIVRQVLRGDVDHDVRDISARSEQPVQFVQGALGILGQRLDDVRAEADPGLARRRRVASADQTADDTVDALVELGGDLDPELGTGEYLQGRGTEFANDFVQIDDRERTAAVSVGAQDVQREELRGSGFVAAIGVPGELELAFGSGLGLAGRYLFRFDVPEPALRSAMSDWRTMFVFFA